MVIDRFVPVTVMAVSLSQSTTADGDCKCRGDDDDDDDFGSTYPSRSRSGTCKCPICDKVVSNDSSVWQHINVEHTTRQSFPDASFLDAHKRNASFLGGHKRNVFFMRCFENSRHCKYCRRTLGAGIPKRRGLIVELSESKWFPSMSASSCEFTEADKTAITSCYFSSLDSIKG